MDGMWPKLVFTTHAREWSDPVSGLRILCLQQAALSLLVRGFYIGDSMVNQILQHSFATTSPRRWLGQNGAQIPTWRFQTPTSAWPVVAKQLNMILLLAKVATSILQKIPPAGSLFSSQPGKPPCWASPLAFGLNGQVFFSSKSFTADLLKYLIMITLS